MDGLDVLLGSQQAKPQNGLDVLLSPPTAGPSPEVSPPSISNPAVAVPAGPAGFSGSAGGGAIQGARDVQNAAAQWLYNAMPKPVQRLGDVADQWLYQKTGGLVGTQPGLNFNQAVAAQNAAYEASRTANKRDGIDWSRALGAGGTQAALAPFLPATSGIGAGMLSGALMPVTNSAYFGPQKAQDIAFGGITGGLLSGIGKTVASAISPKIAPAAQGLLDEGIPLTPGQMKGGMAKSFEDKAASIPVVGEIIKGAQGRAVEGLNTAAYQRVLNPLREAGFDPVTPKVVGREGVDAITKEVSGAYNTLVPKLVFHSDPQFVGELAITSQRAVEGLAPPQFDRFKQIIANNLLKNMTPDGAITGKTLQGTLEDIGKQATGYIHDPSFENRQLGTALQTVEQSIKDGLTRANPQYAGQLSKVNEAFANLTRVQTAAASQGSANGVFTAAQLSAAVKAGDKTIRDNAFARGQALMQDLSDPAKALLTSGTPNSGTADRAMTAGALGALFAHPSALLNPALWAASVPSLAYTKTGQQLTQAALTARPAGSQTVAEAIRRGTAVGVLPAAGGLLTEFRP